MSSNDPLAELEEGAAMLHRAYLSYRSAGFNAEEALELTKEMMRLGFMNALKPG